MNYFLKVLILGFFCLYSSNVWAVEGKIREESIDIDEIIVEEDPFIGVTIELEKFQPMVYMSNFRKELYGSLYVHNINRLVATLADSKEYRAEQFKNNRKKIKFLNSKKKFTIVQVLKSVVYKDNIPDEFTTYILKDSEGKLFAIPELTLKEVSKERIKPFEKELLLSFKDVNEKAKVIIYFEKPSIYSHKKAPYSKEDLNSVFEFFFSNIAGTVYEDVKKSTRTFRLTMTVPVDTLAYIISEFEQLHIEDLEVIAK